MDDGLLRFQSFAQANVGVFAGHCGGYRGRGRGRGGYGGRGHTPYNANHSNNGWKPHLGTYTDDEWYGLSWEQKQEVHALRESNRNGQNNDQSNRQIQQVTGDGGESTITDLPPTPSIQVPNAPSSGASVPATRGTAGNAFGART